MNQVVPANDIKTKGASAFDPVLEEHDEAMISVRGKNKYVVMKIETYNYYRECELEAAVLEAKKDLKNKDYYEESVEDHIKRISEL